MTDRDSPSQHVFIAYASADIAFARRLAADLQKAGISIWIDSRSLRPGDSFVEVAGKALNQTAAVVIVLSKDAMESKWLRYEVSSIKDKRPSLPLVFFLLDDIAVPSDLEGIQAIRVGQDYDAALARAIQSLQTLPVHIQSAPQTPSIPAPAFHVIGRESLVAEILRQFQTPGVVGVLLVGGAGTGKSTLAQLVAHTAQADGVFKNVALVETASSDVAQRQTLHEICRQLNLDLTLETTPTSTILHLESVLRTEPTLIVVDGLDLLSDHEHTLVTRLLGAFVAPDCRSKLLLTSQRHPNWLSTDQDLLKRLPIVEIPPFTQSDLQQYLAHRLGQGWEALWHELNTGHWSVELTPLLLNLVATQWRLAGTIPSSPPDATVSDIVSRTIGLLGSVDKEVLEALSLLRAPASERSISTLIPSRDVRNLPKSLQRLIEFGFVHEADDRRFQVHPSIRDVVLERMNKETNRQGGTLYLTIDPSLMSRDDFVEFLDALNSLYVDIGGSELIIREDEVGLFAGTGVLV